MFVQFSSWARIGFLSWRLKFGFEVIFFSEVDRFCGSIMSEFGILNDMAIAE